MAARPRRVNASGRHSTKLISERFRVVAADRISVLYKRSNVLVSQGFGLTCGSAYHK
jgi:hypothetical protein